MAVEFTKDQLKAIETLDKSILVSAAAGSGKTAVLVERILNIILEGKANVDEMLIVTFTNAAAAEMRLRLASAIRKRMQEKPEDAPRLKDQLGRLYRAYISTIDSFALRVIREFFYETDIEPDFGTCDEVQGELLRREAAAELFEAGFDDDMFLSRDGGEDVDRIGFREFLRLYSRERSEDEFMENLMITYSRLRTMPDYFNWAYERAEDLKTDKESFEGSALQAIIAKDAADTVERAFGAAVQVQKLFEEADLMEMYKDKLTPEISYIAEIHDDLAAGKFDDEVIGKLNSLPSVRLVAKKAWKEQYEPIKPEVKRLREIYKGEIKALSQKYFAPDFETRLREMNDTYVYTVYYLRLLEEFERRRERSSASRPRRRTHRPRRPCRCR